MARTSNDTSDLARSVGATGADVAATPAYRQSRHRSPEAGTEHGSPEATRPAKKPKKKPSSSIARRAWIPIVTVVVLLIAAFCVNRVRGFFGSTEITRPGAGLAQDPEPFDPKEVTYEIFGVPGAMATINYLDLEAQPQKAVDVTLPWSLELTTTAPAASPNIIAQGDGDTISCRITVDGEVKDERTSNGVNAQTFCLVKSA